MLSFFGEQALKDAVVERIKEHQRLDQIVQGIYWDGAKGCGIGCVLHSDEHMAFERQLGLPVFLAYMDEHIFESLPKEDAKYWPLRFIEAVPVGVDLELVFPRFMHWVLTDPDGLVKHANAHAKVIINDVATMYARRIEGIPFDRAAAWAAETAAWAAAWAARAAARAAAWEAAWEAARASAWAAETAAEEAAAWAARAAARAARAARADGNKSMIHRQADYLITLLQSYESRPLNTQPCPEKINELLPAWKQRS